MPVISPVRQKVIVYRIACISYLYSELPINSIRSDAFDLNYPFLYISNIYLFTYLLLYNFSEFQ